MPQRLQQKTVDAGCVAARERYMQLSIAAAKEQISYELQGFLAAMNDRHEWPLAQGIFKMTELLDLIARQNDI
jgi:hypothetical protein